MNAPKYFVMNVTILPVKGYLGIILRSGSGIWIGKKLIDLF
jgi:hypothetical protein